MIDGLRGVAAMMVVCYHLYGNIGRAVSEWFPAFLDAVFRHGYVGVDVFFVLSGFVIPHSLRNGKFSLAFLGRYGLRRSIRLDPPLWATIAIELALVRAGLYFFPDLGSVVPSWKQVFANAAYLQEILRLGNVVSVFWSLTYEVQFYLVLVSCCVFAAWLRRFPFFVRWGRPLAYGLATLAFLYSVAIFHRVTRSPLPGLFLIRWFEFFLGALVWGAVSRRIDSKYFAMGAAVAFASVLLSGAEPFEYWSTVAALAASGFILWAGLTGRLSTLLSGRGWQFMGRISYSLYLLHVCIGWRFVSLCLRVLGEPFSPLTGIAVLSSAIAVSILGAALLYRTVEVWSVRLARRIDLPMSRRLRASSDLSWQTTAVPSG
jgi:peptidoglycan/LPS O-acetylase OafA/YrhL